MTDVLSSHSLHANPLTGSVFSPLTLFESTITNAQMLVESMAERELFSALRIIGCLHSHVVHVMEPRYSRLCERSDRLAHVEANGGAGLRMAPTAASVSATAAPTGGIAKEEKVAAASTSASVLGSALNSIKMENCDSFGLAGAALSAPVGEEPPELLEEDADDEDDEDDCVITDYFDESSSFGASSFGPRASKASRMDVSGGGAGGHDVPTECKTIMRRAYKALKGNGPHLFDFSLPFSAEQNQRVAARVTAKAKEMAQGKGWPEDIWQKLPYGSRPVTVFLDFRQKMRVRHRGIVR